MTEMTKEIADLLREREYLEIWEMCHGGKEQLLEEAKKVAARLDQIRENFVELGAECLNG